MSTSSSLRQQFGAFCTNVPLGVRTLLEAPGLTTTLTAPKTALCVCPPLGKRFSSTGSTVGGVLKKRRSRRLVCVHPWTKGFPRPLQSGRGVWHSRPTTRNEAVGESGKQGPISPAYLLFYQAVTPLFLWFASWCFHDTSPKPSFCRVVLQLSRADRSFCRLTNNLLKHLQVFQTLHHAVPSPSFPSEKLSLTENQCQSVTLVVFCREFLALSAHDYGPPKKLPDCFLQYQPPLNQKIFGTWLNSASALIIS